MSQATANLEVPVEQLRWRLDPATLAFETTQDIEPLRDIIGQDRGVEAFRFGINIDKPGYNVFVTGLPGSGRMATVKKLLEEMSKKERVPDDFCYVNCFQNPDSPLLLRLPGGTGAAFKRDVKWLVERLKKEIPQLFESEEYTHMKKEIMEAYNEKAKAFFKSLDQHVKQEGFTIVDVQMGQFKRPEVMPVIEEKPVPIDQLEAMTDQGQFAKEKFEKLKQKYVELRQQIEHIFKEIGELQKEIVQKTEQMDRAAFLKTASDIVRSLADKYKISRIRKWIEDMLEEMADNLKIFMPQKQPQIPGFPPMMAEADLFQPYEVNLFVDNSGRKSPPVIIEGYPTYRNIFGSIERIVDRGGMWRTDFSKIKSGSLVQANGGFLVINLRDAVVEPGVWLALKRALKSKKLEIQTFDPMYFISTTGLKPEPIELDVKVVVVGDAYLYEMIGHYDEDLRKIFKVRADFDTAMDKNEETIQQFAQFIKTAAEEEDLKPFGRTAVAALIEQAVRMAGRQEKISTSFPAIADLIREADYWARRGNGAIVQGEHVDKAIEAKIYRSNLMEEKIQEMIDRGTLMIDTEGAVVGQVNGLAVYSLGDYMFGKPSRITASTSMGRAGVINIERESDMSGNTHNKGVLILSGYLRQKYAQDKPLTMSASIAFEQSYSGVDGDSASSTEIYALLSSLSGDPIKQNIAVTGSVNQKGEVQAIGGVNQKIEGFFECCRQKGLTGDQGVMIPASNVNDLMLRKNVLEAVESKQFHIYAVKTVDEGIEILTGRPAGVKDGDGKYPPDTINYLVEQRLHALAEGIKAFGPETGEVDRKKKERP